MQYNILIILFICFCSTSLSSQKLVTNEISKRVYTTKKLVEVPIIDGKISEIAWDVVDWSSNFVENDQNEGTAPMYQTKFKVM